MIGYDKYSINHQLLFDLTLEETVGGDLAYVYDRAKPHHRCVLHGATIGWTLMPSGLTVIDCTVDDWIDCLAADTGDLDFVAGDFSMGMWVNLDDLSANRMLLCRGLLNIDGWHCAILMDGSVVFYTSQLGANQSSLSALAQIIVGTSYLIGFSRSGASIKIFINGVEVTNTIGVHTNPLTADRELHIGIYDNEAGSPWNGQLWRPRIWERELSLIEWKRIFDVEGHWFGY